MAGPDRDFTAQPNAAERRGAYFVAEERRQFPRRAVVAGALLIAIAAGVVIWRMERRAAGLHGTEAPNASATPSSVQSGAPVPERAAQVLPAGSPYPIVSAFGTTGQTVRELLSALEKSTGKPLKCDLRNAPVSLLDLRLSEYDGDPAITPAEALDLLQYAGLVAEFSPPSKGGDTEGVQFSPPSKGGDTEGVVEIVVRPQRSAERLWARLTASVDPDGLEWGVLRPWRALKVSFDTPAPALIAKVKAGPTAEAVSLLAWAVHGTARSWKLSEDGRLSLPAGGQMQPAEQQDARDVFVAAASAAEPSTRAAAAYGLGQILDLNNQAQHPADGPLLATLAKLLKDADSEVVCSAALALGNTASVSALATLTEALLLWREKPAEHAAVLAAITRAESLGRRLDQTFLGNDEWERRRALLQSVRTWLASNRRNSDTPRGGFRFTTAWARLARVLHVDLLEPEYAAGLVERMWQSGQTGPQLVAADLDRSGKLAVAPNLPPAVRLAIVAGPLWWQNRLTTEQALALLSSSDPLSISPVAMGRELARSHRAILWRLSRPEARGFELNPRDEDIQHIAAYVEKASRNADSPTLRRLALDALYREHRRKRADGTVEPWRLRWEPDLAHAALMQDADAGVQLAAAGALGQLATPTQMTALAAADLSKRSPEAVERFLYALTQRWLTPGAQFEFMIPATMDLAEKLAASENAAVAARAAFLRMQQPGLEPEARLKLVMLFKVPATRASAIRALATGLPPPQWPATAIGHLLADSAPVVRRAIFECGLLRCVVPAAERASLYLKGLSDSDASVRVAALNSLGRTFRELPEVAAVVEKLSRDDANPEVRAAAVELLHPKLAK